MQILAKKFGFIEREVKFFSIPFLFINYQELDLSFSSQYYFLSLKQHNGERAADADMSMSVGYNNDIRNVTESHRDKVKHLYLNEMLEPKLCRYKDATKQDIPEEIDL